MKIIPNTASQRRRSEAGLHSNLAQLYGVNWNAMRFIFPLEGKVISRWLEMWRKTKIQRLKIRIWSNPAFFLQFYANPTFSLVISAALFKKNKKQQK